MDQDLYQTTAGLADFGFAFSLDCAYNSPGNFEAGVLCETEKKIVVCGLYWLQVDSRT